MIINSVRVLWNPPSALAETAYFARVDLFWGVNRLLEILPARYESFINLGDSATIATISPATEMDRIEVVYQELDNPYLYAQARDSEGTWHTLGLLPVSADSKRMSFRVQATSSPGQLLDSVMLAYIGPAGGSASVRILWIYLRQIGQSIWDYSPGGGAWKTISLSSTVPYIAYSGFLHQADEIYIQYDNLSAINRIAVYVNGYRVGILSKLGIPAVPEFFEIPQKVSNESLIYGHQGLPIAMSRT